MADGEAGRPTICTPDVIEAVCENVKAGMPRKWAAIHAGISKATYYDWKARGEKGDQPYATFLDRLTRAEAQDMANLIAEVGGAQTNLPQGVSQSDWRAQAWLLERRFRPDYGKVTAHELTGANGGAIKTEAGLDGKSTAELAALLARVESMESPDKD